MRTSKVHKSTPKKLDPDQRLKALGELLREARVASGLSQNDVAKVLGLATPQLISNWENGRSSPPMKHIEKLTRIYPIDLDKFFDFLVDYTASHAELRIRKNLQRLPVFRKS
jgi:transcriptional regulator with XRE-family HTH domain